MSAHAEHAPAGTAATGPSPSGPGAHQAHHAHSPQYYLWRLLAPETRDIWVLLVYSSAVGLLSLATPIAVQALVSTVAFGTLLQPLVVLTALLGIGLAFAATMRALQSTITELIQQRLFVRVAAELAWRLPRAEVAAFDRAHGPELVNRFFDVLTVQKAAATLLLDGLALALQTGVGMLLLGFYHPLLLAFDAALVLGLLIVLLPLGRGALRTSIAESKSKYAVAAWLEELARHPTAFHSRGGAETAMARAEQLSRKYLDYRRAHFRVLLRQIVGSLTLQAVAHTLLLGLGGWLVIARQLTLGQLVAAELVVTAVIAGIAKLPKQLETWYDLLAASDKLGHLVDLPLERDGGEQPAARRGGAHLALRGVRFEYEGDVGVLDDASIEVTSGARVGLTGHIGQGKSTVLELAYGLRQPSRGVLTYDGVDLRELALDALRDEVELVGSPEIFEGTVEDNVRLGRSGVGPAEVRNALTLVGLAEQVAALPEGVKTLLSSGGSPLSPGEARQLAIARAIASQPRLLLLDETLDGLPANVRDRLLDALFAPSAPWSLLVVSHDPAVLARCDRVLQLAGGAPRAVSPNALRPNEVRT